MNIFIKSCLSKRQPFIIIPLRHPTILTSYKGHQDQDSLPYHQISFIHDLRLRDQIIVSSSFFFLLNAWFYCIDFFVQFIYFCHQSLYRGIV